MGVPLLAGVFLLFLAAPSAALVRPGQNATPDAAAKPAAELDSDGLLLSEGIALPAANASANASTASQPGDANATQQIQQQPALETVRILHLSDTHTLHHTIEAKFPLPPADIVLITGDVTNFGTDAEVADFDAWLGTLKGRYPHIFMISGNHDWINSVQRVHSGQLSPQAVLDPLYFKRKLRNAQVLEHEQVEVLGLRIFGSAWCPWCDHGYPSRPSHAPGAAEIWKAWQAMGGKPHRYDEIPEGVDVLMTHGPPWGILDHISTGQWGSSPELLQALERAKPKVHLFGHVHEQRGFWEHVEAAGIDNDGFVGGVEYEIVPGSGVRYATTGPPATTLPVDLISNNAMMNLPALEGWCPARIDGPGRVLVATRSPGTDWHIATLGV